MRALRLADQMKRLRHLLGDRGVEPAARTVAAAADEIEDLRDRCQELRSESKANEAHAAEAESFLAALRND